MATNDLGLVTGRMYRFEYTSCAGRKVYQFGRFIKVSVEDTETWYWFATAAGEIPFERAAINCLIDLT